MTIIFVPCSMVNLVFNISTCIHMYFKYFTGLQVYVSWHVHCVGLG